MAEDLGEKTEQPTDRRRGEARERGQVGKSADLSAAIVLAGATAVTFYLGVPALEGLGRIVRYCLSAESIAFPAAGGIGSITSDAALLAWEAARITAPIMVLMVLVAYLSGYVQVGFLFSLKAIRPNLSRLNVFGGFGRLFSRRALVKGGIDLLKLCVVGAVMVAAIRSEYDELVALAALPLGAALFEAAHMVLHLALWTLAILIILAIIDWQYQRWQLNQDLRMTKHEVKDERRSSEGDPEVKARRLRLARQIAMQRLQHDVPKADVVVTNPTHYSVALKYDAEKMNAPRVIAKGADYLALKIRYIAAAHGVPIVERPPLARALYHHVKVGREISAEHYEAVAEVLAYVYRLEGRAAAS